MDTELKKYLLFCECAQKNQKNNKKKNKNKKKRIMTQKKEKWTKTEMYT